MVDTSRVHEHDDLIANTHSHTHTHTHGETCGHCGGAKGIERAYAVDDRALQALIFALAKQSGFDAYFKGRSKKRVYIFGPSNDALDRFDQRMTTLAYQLDDQIMRHTVAFIREHTGVALNIAARDDQPT